MVTEQQIIGAVCTHLEISEVELLSPTRTKHLVYGRRLASVLMREAGVTFAAIAAVLQKRDHSTIVHLVKTTRPVTKATVADLDAIRFRLGQPPLIDQAAAAPAAQAASSYLEAVNSRPRIVNSALDVAARSLEAVASWLKAMRR